jgi:hypothetical protein
MRSDTALGRAGLPSLLTPTPRAGLALAAELADQMLADLGRANAEAERPGGTTYKLAPAPAREVVASLLFYSIAAANNGWRATSEDGPG